MDNNSRKRSKLMILPIVIIAVSTFTWFSYRYFEPVSIDSFLPALQRYEEVEKSHEIAVIIPGSTSNTDRAELDVILGRVLVEPMEDSDRFQYSILAIKKIEVLEGKISEVYEIGETVKTRIESLKLAQEDVKGFEVKILTKEIIELAIKQKAIIDEIEILTQVITQRTRDIFERIIEENGALSDEHMISLNEQIADAEIQFDKRTNLFTEMTTNKKEIEHLSIQLKSLAYKN